MPPTLTSIPKESKSSGPIAGVCKKKNNSRRPEPEMLNLSFNVTKPKLSIQRLYTERERERDIYIYI